MFFLLLPKNNILNLFRGVVKFICKTLHLKLFGNVNRTENNYLLKYLIYFTSTNKYIIIKYLINNL